MLKNFEQSLKYVLQDEGGNDDDPQDHGGRTSRGITQREYDSWCRLNSKPQGDVWSASDSDVKSIYKSQYWDPYCDGLPSGVDYLFFDISVNAGRTQAVRQFQKALGLKVDGMFGVNTRAAIDATQDPTQLIKDVSDKRRAFYRSLSQFPRYGKGWLSRVDHSEKGALSMAEDVSYIRPPNQSGLKPSQDVPVQPAVSPQTANATGLTAGSLAAMLHQFKDDLSPYQSEIKYLAYGLVGLTLMSFLGSMWSTYQQGRIQKDI